MQDIIARALALRNNGSSSGASAELVQKVQKIEDEYVRSTDEKDIEEISSSIEAIKQEIVDKGAEVKESLDLNSAIKSIRPLSEIANYGAEYTYEDKSYGKFETVKITADTKSDNIIFVTKEGTNTITFQFWDANGRQSVYGGACNGRNLVTVSNTDSQINVFISTIGMKAFRYNSDGTFKNLYDGAFVQKDTVLTKYNTAEYTPTKDYHPVTKKYVDDTIPTSLKNPFPLTFTGASSATYDGSAAVTVDLPSGGNGSTGGLTLLLSESDINFTPDVNIFSFDLPEHNKQYKEFFVMFETSKETDSLTTQFTITLDNITVGSFFGLTSTTAKFCFLFYGKILENQDFIRFFSSSSNPTNWNGGRINNGISLFSLGSTHTNKIQVKKHTNSAAVTCTLSVFAR